MPLTAWFFRGLFLASVVVLLLAFQDDLKRFFERLAVWGLGRQSGSPGDSTVESVVRTSLALANVRHGALIVLPGREPLDRHLEGGVPLDGTVSDLLLLSLFDPHSPGHDGAIVVDTERVRRFGVHLPLSADFAELGSRGTRHAAALGLTEQCDALVVVVSEERGVVSVAEGGSLSEVESPDALRARIARFVATTRARPVKPRAPGTECSSAPGSGECPSLSLSPCGRWWCSARRGAKPRFANRCRWPTFPPATCCARRHPARCR